jgi:F-type H+-transporting ATPase subunit c
MRKILTFLSTFFSMALFSTILWAQEHAEAAAGGMGSNTGSVLAISAGLTIAIAAAGGAFGQSRAAAAALEGIGRNPGAANKLQTPMIIALALIESLVIYALVIAFLLQGKI